MVSRRVRTNGTTGERATAGRRGFLTLVGLAVAAGASQGTAAASQGAGADAEPAALVDADLEPAEALLAYVEAVYGDRLDGDDGETILAGIEGSLASGGAFREVGLENADEPAFTFSAYRGEE